MGFLSTIFGGSAQPEAVEEVKRDAATDDIWSVLSSETDSGPTVRELETATEKSGIVGPAIRELTETSGKADISGDFRLRTLFRNPNSYQDFTELLSSIIQTYMATGVAYILPKPVGSAYPEELHLLRSSDIFIQPGPLSDPYRSIHYHTHYEQATFKREDLIVWLVPGFIHPAFPHSPLEEVWDTIQADIAREQAKRLVAKKLPHLLGMVETPERTNKPQRDQLSQSLKDQIGAEVIVLPGGAKMQLPDLGAAQLFEPAPEEAQARICAALNVPPILAGFKVGLDSMTYSNYQEARTSFYNETIEPLLTSLSGAITRDMGRELLLTVPEPDTPEDTDESDTPTTEDEDAD